MNRKDTARERATLTAIERIEDPMLKVLWARQAMQINGLPEATVNENAHDAGRFALMAFGEMEV